MTQRLRMVGVLALAAGLAWGCGGAGHEAFEDCGNGVLDAGEACDDGNLDDSDACLSTCAEAFCGDDFVNQLAEDCDGLNLFGRDCQSLGLGGGTLACDASCSFDTSRCGGAGTPVATPTPLPTSADGTPGPTPTATPQGPTCVAGDTVVVQLSLDAAYGGAVTSIAYPTDSVVIPGSFGDDAVAARVIFLPSGGFDQVNDQDTDNDGVDDTLSASFAGTESNSPGPFVEVAFDCIEGQERPDAAAFACTVDSASDELGNPLSGVGCALAIVGP